ncbi:hypothetical protein M6B38_207070 [Iris pallida]|uniref:Uncharacterized protein n=1 Tax=Iris pallida TaxID=29817 RepID=A0AAX6E6A5_IRIPA|nr:hypothetical protein M6B38_207070 [Iris pallida]
MVARRGPQGFPSGGDRSARVGSSGDRSARIEFGGGRSARVGSFADRRPSHEQESDPTEISPPGATIFFFWFGKSNHKILHIRLRRVDVGVGKGGGIGTATLFPKQNPASLLHLIKRWIPISIPKIQQNSEFRTIPIPLPVYQTGAWTSCGTKCSSLRWYMEYLVSNFDARRGLCHFCQASSLRVFVV